MTATATAATLTAKVNGNEFANALRHVATASKAFGYMEMVTDADAGLLHLAGVRVSDGVALEVAIPAEVTESREAFIATKAPLAFLEGFILGDIAITWAKGSIIFETSDSALEVDILSSAFPYRKGQSMKPFFTIGRADLAEIRDTITHCAGHDEAKPWLTGIQLTVGENLTAIATNGVRVARWSKPISTDQAGQIIIEPGLIQFAVLLSDPGEQLQFLVNDTMTAIVGHSFTVWADNLQGTYPDVMRLVPNQYPHKATVAREILLAAVRVAMRLGTDTAFTLETAERRVTLEVNRPGLGRFTRRLPGTVLGESVRIGLAGSQVLRLLQSFRGAEIVIEYDGARKPIAIRCEDQPHLHYVVLPLITV